MGSRAEPTGPTRPGFTGRRSRREDHDVAYDLRDNHVSTSTDDATGDAAPATEPGAQPERIFDEAMTRLEAITREWSEAIRSV